MITTELRSVRRILLRITATVRGIWVKGGSGVWIGRVLISGWEFAILIQTQDKQRLEHYQNDTRSRARGYNTKTSMRTVHV